VRLVEDNISTHFEQVVHRAQLDLAVVRLPCTRRDLRVRRLLREPLVAILPPTHPLRDRSEILLEELRDEEFVTMQPRYGLHELLLTVCARAGFTPRVSVATGQLSTVWGMVRAGLGVAVLPRIATPSDVPCTRVADEYAMRELGVIWRADQTLSAGARAFLRMLIGGTAQFDEPGQPDEHGEPRSVDLLGAG
jgi:LysR family hydrogen peroxide-inducible transcriptional activator